MRSAALSPPAEVCLVDGFRLGPTAPPHRAIVDGDTKSAAIAAASIVAKVVRDRAMRRMDAVFPHYGFSSHVGYITPGHSAVVRERGPSPIHRRSFQALCYVRQCRGQGSGQQAERRALRHYRLRGYRILGVNVWSAGYELDLIVRRGRRLVFCEVKSKSGRGFGRPDRDGRPREAAAPVPGCRGLARRNAERSGASTSRSTSSPWTRPRASPRAARRSTLEARTPCAAVAPTQEALYDEHRPRALVVRARAARARADEARPPAAPVPGQVHPAARRGSCSSATCRPGGRVLDPFAGSGTTLVQALESGHDATGVDIAAFNALLMRGQDDALQPRSRSSTSCARRARGSATLEPQRRRRCESVRPALVRAATPPPSCSRSVRSIRDYEHRGRPAASCWRARRARRAARRTSTSTSRATPQTRPVLVPQAQARVPAGRTARPTSCAATRSTRSRRDQGVRASPRARRMRDRAPRRRARARSRRSVRRDRHVAAVSGPDRLPRAAPLRVRAARARRPRRRSSSARVRRSRAIADYVDGIAQVLERSAAPFARGCAVSSWS